MFYALRLNSGARFVDPWFDLGRRGLVVRELVRGLVGEGWKWGGC